MLLKNRLTVLLLLCMMGISSISFAQGKATSKVTIELSYEDTNGNKHSETIEYTGKEADQFDADEYEKSLKKRDIKIRYLNINQSISTGDQAHDVKIKRKPGKSKKSVSVKKIIVSDADALTVIDESNDSFPDKVEEKGSKILINGEEIEDNTKQIRILKTVDDAGDMKVEIKDGKVFINGKEVDDLEINKPSEHRVIIKQMEHPEPGEYSDNVIIKKLSEVDSDEIKNTWITKEGEEIELDRTKIKIDEMDGNMIFISDDTPSKPRLGIMIEDDKAINGAAIIDVVPDSPAAKAGLQKGDTVTSINDQPVYGATSMMAEIEAFESGDEVDISYSRNGKSMTSKIKLDMMNSEIKKRIIIKNEK